MSGSDIDSSVTTGFFTILGAFIGYFFSMMLQYKEHQNQNARDERERIEREKSGAFRITLFLANSIHFYYDLDGILERFLENAPTLPSGMQEPYALVGETVGEFPDVGLSADDLYILFKKNEYTLADQIEFLRLRRKTIENALQKYFMIRADALGDISVSSMEGSLGTSSLPDDQFRKIEPKMAMMNTILAHVVRMVDEDKWLSEKIAIQFRDFCVNYFKDERFPSAVRPKRFVETGNSEAL